MTRAVILLLSLGVPACSGATVAPPEERSPVLSSPWLTPPATAGVAAATQPVPTAAPRTPDVVFDPAAPIIHGPAGAMRSVPGPVAGGGEVRSPPPFDEVRGQLETVRQGTRRCYERALQTHPDLRGRLSVRVVFDAAGGAIRVEVVERQGVPSHFADCVTALFQRLEIEPGAEQREITVPFVLVQAHFVR